jgi:hypothetical protein
MYNILDENDDHRLRALHQALFALNDQLALRHGSVHLIVIGGSGLIAIDAVSRATRDVDVVALERDGELVSAEPLPAAVRDAARRWREISVWRPTT